jgi:periplasmic divalent cation tolerance protein
MDYCIIYVTTPDEETAENIARALVEEKLAACANIVPRVRSIFRWKDNIEDENEVLMILKTRAELFDRAEKRVGTMHPYEVPEIVAVPLTRGSKPYLDWLSEST